MVKSRLLALFYSFLELTFSFLLGAIIYAKRLEQNLKGG
jgi:hypothetical protein